MRLFLSTCSRGVFNRWAHGEAKVTTSEAFLRASRLSFTELCSVAMLIAGLSGARHVYGEEPSPVATKDATSAVWEEGATVRGRVLDHGGRPVANAEVLLLGRERIVVEAERRTWFSPERDLPKPPSTRTDKEGRFSITRKQGTADRLAVIAQDPLLWVFSRSGLSSGDDVEITLPEAGSLAVQCDLPGKPAKQPVMIDLKTFDGTTFNGDSLRFHSASSSLVNPGETVFKHLPPAEYAVQRNQDTKTGLNTVLMTGADRRIVKIESAKRASITIDRSVGKPLSGQVLGLENAELRYAHLTISGLGPEEVFGKNGKKSRMFVAFDVIPIASDGRFTTDPIPPGDYTTSLFAVLESTPQLSSQRSDFSGTSRFSIPEEGEHPKVEIIAKPEAPRDLADVTDLRLRVVDEDGKPLPKFEAMVHTADAGNGPWAPGRNGIVFLGGATQYRDGPLDVLLRSNDHAPMIARFTVKEREKLSKGEAAVTVKRGQKVRLGFKLPESMTWPKGALPEAYFDDLQARVRMMRQPVNRRPDVVSDFNMLSLREVGEGQFEFWLAEETPRFHVAIHVSGFLQSFESGPFTLADVKDGKLEIDVPRPATLEVSFGPGDHADSAAPYKSVSLDVMSKLQGDSYLEVATQAGPSVTPSLKLNDLAPGEYMISVRTQPEQKDEQVAGTKINLGRYFDRQTLELKAGQSERVAFRPKPFDPNVFKGSRNATVRIRTTEGEPAKGRNASITYYDGHYGALDVFSGIVPASGDIELKGITDKAVSSTPQRSYVVTVDGNRLGAFGFTNESPTQEFEFVLVPSVGDVAPDLKLTNLVTGEELRLSSYRGQVVFLEFWATWCGPCQQPMGKLNAICSEPPAAWKDRVAIVPVAINSDAERVKSHVQKRGWTALNPFWAGESEAGDFDTPAARAFVVSGVPDAVLIGPEGRILWRGHPMDTSESKDLKSRIDDALKATR
jgi:thiol-disulfide isomerase/thioredoxin